MIDTTDVQARALTPTGTRPTGGNQPDPQETQEWLDALRRGDARRRPGAGARTRSRAWSSPRITRGVTNPR